MKTVLIIQTVICRCIKSQSTQKIQNPLDRFKARNNKLLKMNNKLKVFRICLNIVQVRKELKWKLEIQLAWQFQCIKA